MAFVISGNSGEQGHPLDHLCMLALENMQSWEWSDIPTPVCINPPCLYRPCAAHRALLFPGSMCAEK